MATNNASKFFLICILFVALFFTQAVSIGSWIIAIKQYHVILDFVVFYVSYLITYNVGSVIPQVVAAAIVMVNSSALHLMFIHIY
ncbi:hypothetical protein S83_042190, partial [Arachis hypogaea]